MKKISTYFKPLTKDDLEIQQLLKFQATRRCHENIQAIEAVSSSAMISIDYTHGNNVVEVINDDDHYDVVCGEYIRNSQHLIGDPVVQTFDAMLRSEIHDTINVNVTHSDQPVPALLLPKKKKKTIR
jgi:excinuclease UvrABC nuclease subunit